MKKGKIVMTITIGIVCFLLTMIIFMQFKVVRETEETNIDTMQEAELRQELANWKSKYDETKERYDEISATLESYKEETSSDSQTKETLEAELENLELQLGKTDVEGEGVVITLSEKSEQELEEEEQIISIKAEDLVYIVNYLKDSGAEAISINDERIVNTTDIADVGDAIKINSKYCSKLPKSESVFFVYFLTKRTDENHHPVSHSCLRLYASAPDLHSTSTQPT